MPRDAACRPQGPVRFCIAPPPRLRSCTVLYSTATSPAVLYGSVSHLDLACGPVRFCLSPRPHLRSCTVLYSTATLVCGPVRFCIAPRPCLRSFAVLSLTSTSPAVLYGSHTSTSPAVLYGSHTSTSPAVLYGPVRFSHLNLACCGRAVQSDPTLEVRDPGFNVTERNAGKKHDISCKEQTTARSSKQDLLLSSPPVIFPCYAKTGRQKVESCRREGVLTFNRPVLLINHL